MSLFRAFMVKMGQHEVGTPERVQVCERVAEAMLISGRLGIL
jgi:hypothetical protein